MIGFISEPRRRPSRSAIRAVCHLLLITGTSQAIAANVDRLVEHALSHNPELRAARARADAAAARVASAGALDDPMLEAGVVNAPLPFSLRREDMTMQMVAVSQRLPYAGKRELRRNLAAAEASGAEGVADELANRLRRDVRAGYADLELAAATARLNRRTLEDLRRAAEIVGRRFAVGKATQVEVLMAQSQVARSEQTQVRLDRDEASRRSELTHMVLEDFDESAPLEVSDPSLLPEPDAVAGTLVERAEHNRPALRARLAEQDRSTVAIALARKEYYPDVDVKLGYGMRRAMLDGTKRDDVVSLTFAVNLPIWRKNKLEPRVAEARAAGVEARDMIERERHDIRNSIEQSLATVKAERSAELLARTYLLPQLRAALASAEQAYQSSKSDLTQLIELHAQLDEAETNRLVAINAHNRAVIEIDYVTGAGTPAAAGDKP